MASKSPSPKLGKSQALNVAQATITRLTALVPSLTTQLSPVTVYQPGATVGNELIASSGTAIYGVWVAPDLNGDGSEYYVQVECFGAGGGGGGGNSSQGGGGGGGAEYACEDQYPVKPGASYAYALSLGGSGGFSNSSYINPGSSGVNGGATVFDIAGLGLATGVIANGGQGADQTTAGIGGAGGTGSQNTIHFDGGAGGTNNSDNGSDNPVSLAQASGMFVGNTLSKSIIPCWYILNDAEDADFGVKCNDNSNNSKNGSITSVGKGIGFQPGAIGTPTQVPAFTAPAQPPVLPNGTTANATSWWENFDPTSPAAKIVSPAFVFSGSKLTVSCWIQCDPSGTWGNTAANSYGVIAANTQNYNGNSMKGYALFLVNQGTAGAPSWKLFGAVGNGTSRTLVSIALPPVVGTWYYVVMTYNAGTLKLYVNNSLVNTAASSGYTSVPAGGFATTVSIDPNGTANWFFGYISNIWWANDCATTVLINQAFGTTPATGGAGGGASGGPGGPGGIGTAAAGATGGAGGIAPAATAALAAITTLGDSGGAGGTAASGGHPPASGGTYGGGGGGNGDKASPATAITLTIPFSSAAAYYGTDASSSPGAIYNTNQQNNPGSSVNSVLFAGGLSSDAASGSKNSMLLLPPDIANLIGNNAYLLLELSITFTNAFPSSTVPSVLELGFSADTSLPQTYTGADLTPTGLAIVPAGAGTITYDLTSTPIISAMPLNQARAIILGPGSTPTFNAFNAPAGSSFYASVYGPGAYDEQGNPQFPYLTAIFQPVNPASTQSAGFGDGGAIVITAIDNEETPIATIQPFAVTDIGGNQFAEGYTGQVSAFDPTLTTPGSFAPESWKLASLVNGYANAGTTNPKMQFKLLSTGEVMLAGVLNTSGATLTSGTTIFTLPSQYWPTKQARIPMMVQGTSVAPVTAPFLNISTAGVCGLVTGSSLAGTSFIGIFGTYSIDPTLN